MKEQLLECERGIILETLGGGVIRTFKAIKSESGGTSGIAIEVNYNFGDQIGNKEIPMIMSMEMTETMMMDWKIKFDTKESIDLMIKELLHARHFFA